MKKFISILLCVAMLVSTLAVFGAAQENDAQLLTVADSVEQAAEAGALGEGEYPIVFVTGIGQSYSYLYDADGNVQARWNLFCNDFSFMWTEVGTYITILRIVSGVFLSLAIGKNVISKDALDDLVNSLFRYNIIDKNGALPSNVVTPLYECSVADMTEEAKESFYRTIPCKDVIGDLGEENLYCFNYSAFSFTYNNAANLDRFINETVLEQTNAEKVVLIPMSMGASVVSAYLQDYGRSAKVARVVSIVGAWDGSDVFADLIELKYAENAPEMVYNGLVAELVGEPWGYLVNVVIRIFPKAVLRSIIDEALNSLVENLVLKTPSLLALIPRDRYQAIRSSRLEGNSELEYIMRQTDKYYQAQTNLESYMNELNSDYGVEFFFIAGYGLGFGGFSSDYSFFQFLRSAAQTNSDEIIQVSSTVPGASFVTAGSQFDSAYLASHDARYISPDKSVDVSTSFFPDRAWLFCGQKHELENNNTALKLALSIARGEITRVSDEPEAFPQFNESRDLKKLVRNYIPDLNKWLESNAPTAEQQALIDANTAAVNSMMARTVNDREADDEIIADYYNMLVELGIYSAPSQPSAGDVFLNNALKSMSDNAYKIFGAKGFVDIFKR